MRFEMRQMRTDAVACGHRKAADPVTITADEVGQTHIRAAFPLGDLLAQERQADMAFIVEMDDNIITVACAWP